MGRGVVWAELVEDGDAVALAVAVGLAVELVQLQSVADVQSGFRQKPSVEQTSPDAQFALLPQVPLHEFGVAAGDSVGLAVGLGDGLAVAFTELQTVMSVVQEAPGEGQQ